MDHHDLSHTDRHSRKEEVDAFFRWLCLCFSSMFRICSKYEQNLEKCPKTISWVSLGHKSSGHDKLRFQPSKKSLNYLLCSCLS